MLNSALVFSQAKAHPCLLALKVSERGTIDRLACDKPVRCKGIDHELRDTAINCLLTRAGGEATMIKPGIFALVLFLMALSPYGNNPALAQLTKLNVGYSAISGDQMPAWVAKEAGIFQ